MVGDFGGYLLNDVTEYYDFSYNMYEYFNRITSYDKTICGFMHND